MQGSWWTKSVVGIQSETYNASDQEYMAYKQCTLQLISQCHLPLFQVLTLLLVPVVPCTVVSDT